MSLWDPVLDGPSRHETFTQRLVRDMVGCGRDSRWGFEADLKSMVRAGRVAEAIDHARSSTYSPHIGIGVIAAEVAWLGDVSGAVAAARLIDDPDGRAGAFIDIAEVCRRASHPEAADAALSEAATAAQNIRGVSWRHWRARRLAEVGLARSRLGQPDLARSMCRKALAVAEGCRTVTNDQTLGDVVSALCLIGDVETAVTAIHKTTPHGACRQSLKTLAAALMVDRQVDAGLTLLSDLEPAARFEAFLYAGRMLAGPKNAGWIDQLCQCLQEPDRSAIRIGYASALQDLGKYAEAAMMQQEVLELLRKQGTAMVLPDEQAGVARIAEDLALNLARTGGCESAIDVASLIEEPAARNRILREICVCHAEAGNLQAFRQSLSTLEYTHDRAEALAVGAAAVVHSAATDRCQQHDRASALCQERIARDAADTLICEAHQLARQVSGDDQKDRTLWLITAAATAAGLADAATAAALIIRKCEIQKLAANVIERLHMVALGTRWA